MKGGVGRRTWISSWDTEKNGSALPTENHPILLRNKKEGESKGAIQKKKKKIIPIVKRRRKKARRWCHAENRGGRCRTGRKKKILCGERQLKGEKMIKQVGGMGVREKKRRTVVIQKEKDQGVGYAVFWKKKKKGPANEKMETLREESWKLPHVLRR